MKNLLKTIFGGRSQGSSASPTLNLAAFGKHPGWDDHIPGIGLETGVLAHLKQSLYVTGIGGQIDSGAWEKLEPAKRVEGFAHAFFWRREGHVLMGRLWSSTDRKGRAKYPMVLCADGQSVPMDFLLLDAWKELDQLQTICRAVSTAEAVTAACQSSQIRLRAGIESTLERKDPDKLRAEIKRQFLENPQFGGQGVGLLRILHELGDWQSHQVKSREKIQARHLRVPAISRTRDEIFHLWPEFFQCALPANTPLLLLLRDGGEWLDVIVGEPSGDEFFCLQASLLAQPLSTQIPYEIKPEMEAQLQKVKESFLGMAVPSEGNSCAITIVGKTSPPLKKSKALVLLIIVLLVLVAAGFGGFFIFLHHSPPVNVSAEPLTPLRATPVTPVTSPAPTVPVVTDGQQKFAVALQAGKAAIARQDYTLAVDESKAALTLKPNDPAALSLQQLAQTKLNQQLQTQQQEQNYQVAMQAAQSALSSNDFDGAIKQASAALIAKPNAAAAQAIKTKAEQQKRADQIAQQNQQNYQTAMQAAKTALLGNDYDGTIQQADAALKIMPGDATATRLATQATVQKGVAAAKIVREQNYQTAMQKGLTALAGGNYDEALKQSAAALVIMPSDQAAQNLQADIQFNRVMGIAKKFEADNPGRAGQSLQSALQLKPADTNALALQKQFQSLNKTDAELENLMKAFGVAAHGKIIDPQKGSFPALNQAQRIDYVVNNLKNPKELCRLIQAAYQRLDCLNQERKDDLAALNAEILNVLNTSAAQ